MHETLIERRQLRRAAARGEMSVVDYYVRLSETDTDMTNEEWRIEERDCERELDAIANATELLSVSAERARVEMWVLEMEWERQDATERGGDAPPTD